jgi:hypothetical protein
MIGVWICVVLSAIWLLGLTLLVLSHINYLQHFILGQDAVNEIVDKRHWSFDERMTMFNDRVNNIKRRI